MCIRDSVHTDLSIRIYGNCQPLGIGESIHGKGTPAAPDYSYHRVYRADSSISVIQQAVISRTEAGRSDNLLRSFRPVSIRHYVCSCLLYTS